MKWFFKFTQANSKKVQKAGWILFAAGCVLSLLATIFYKPLFTWTLSISALCLALGSAALLFEALISKK